MPPCPVHIKLTLSGHCPSQIPKRQAKVQRSSRAPRNLGESSRAGHLLILDIPSINSTPGPVIAPITAPLKILWQIRTIAALGDATKILTPAHAPPPLKSTHI